MESITGSMSSSNFIPEDVLIEILLRLPLISLYLFKSVCKHWLSLITSPCFTLRLRNQQMPKIAPVCGLFLQQPDSSAFVPLDVRITACPFGSIITQAGSRFSVLQSCNGLLLCKNIHTLTMEYLVYNPFTNMFKSIRLPPNLLHYNKHENRVKLAFDPTESSHYKLVVCVKDTTRNLRQILTYSSETGKWSIISGQFEAHSFRLFETGVYWNNAIHWIDWYGLYSVLGIEPGREWITKKSVSNACTLFESRGCLLLLVRNNHANYHVFERNKYYGWSMKYNVYLHDIVPWARMLSVLCVVLGEREDDSFMVVEVNGYVLQYKFLSKTVSTLCNSVSSSSFRCSPFIPSLASV